MPSAIGSGLGYMGGALSNLGFPNAATAFGNAGNWFSNPGLPSVVSAPTDVPIPNSYSGPAPIVPTAGSISPPGTVFSGEPGAGVPMPAPGSAEAPENVMAPGSVGGTSSAPYSPANAPAAPSAAPSLLERILGSLFPGKAAASTGTAGGTGADDWTKYIGPTLGLIGTGTTDILKFIQQRNLMNNLGQQATALNRRMNPALVRNVTGPVKATLQETGNINSPYLTSQAIATALAPYAFDQNLADLQAVLEANRLAEGLYPNFDLPGYVQPGVFGGGAGVP